MNPSPYKGTVLIGLSGGIDSSIAAWLLKQNGWNVVAATMSIYDGSIPIPPSDRSGCFGPREAFNIQSAIYAAERIGIPHYRINLAQDYRVAVLDYFRTEYLAGRTPNPCVQCNCKMKFGALQDYARKEGIQFDFFATGHFACVHFDPVCKRYCILRGVDSSKDQSYFISHLSQEQLSNLIFPLGEYHKAEVRAMAQKLGWLDLLGRSESQDFIACDNYSPLFRPSDAHPGKFIDKNGKVLGEHRGIIHYTIGQRRGIGIGGGIPFYVLKIDPTQNTITLGAKEDLYTRELVADQINWVALSECPTKPVKIYAQIRQRHKAAPAELTRLDDNRVRIVFTEPQMAVTPGQIVVFYEGDMVLGAGTIFTN